MLGVTLLSNRFRVHPTLLLHFGYGFYKALKRSFTASHLCLNTKDLLVELSLVKLELSTKAGRQ